MTEMNWSKYADSYELMIRNNPAYHENLDHFTSFLARANLPANAVICDVGAGTGHYITAAAELLPAANYIHLDSDPKMTDIAQHRYADLNISSVQILEDHIQRVTLPESSIDLVVCVHALYSMSPQDQILRKIRKALKPNGRLFIIDLGRKMDVVDWGRYLYRSLRISSGRYRSMLELIKMFSVSAENQRLSKAQNEGNYSSRTTEEFHGLLQDSGFQVDYSTTCYRGYSDLAICSNSPTELRELSPTVEHQQLSNA